MTATLHPNQRVGRVTLRAHPDQPLSGHGTLLFGGNEWEWGPEWSMGDRSGRWAVATDSLSSYAVRVEWDASAPIIDGFAFGVEVSRGVNARPEAEMADMRSRLLHDLAAFDEMCADLWERRDKPPVSDAEVER